MPAGMGAPGIGGLAAAGAGLGIPQPGAVPGSGGLEEILNQLTSGQISAEKLLMLLALLSQGGGGQLPPAGPPQGAGPMMGPGGPIGAAMGGGGMPPL